MKSSSPDYDSPFDEFEEPPPVEIPIDGELDLHIFRPQDIGEVLPEYLRECRKRGIYQVRVVHGKGTGTLRTTAHKLLDRLDFVTGYKLAGEGSGGWGATWVGLKK
jgi:DNA-nicking Smr family endonuclease